MVNSMPRWYEYFWFAFGVYFTLNKAESPADEGANIASCSIARAGHPNPA